MSKKKTVTFQEEDDGDLEDRVERLERTLGLLQVDI